MRAVYATDLSAAIDAAMESKVCLECLERYGIDEIDLINVVSPNVTAGMPGSDIGSRTKEALERQKATLEGEGFTVNTKVVRGAPHRRIINLADQVNADLIIVGSRGKSPLKERLIGGTTRDVARTASQPLLVQRIVEPESGADPEVANEHLFERVLYATDFSENAEHAFERFSHMTQTTEEALLLHVAPPERRAGADGADLDDAEARLAKLADRLHDLGIDAETTVRRGETVTEILAAEDEFDPTTILMGSRGTGRIRRLLLGSTSEEVTAKADSNVLLVPPAKHR